MSTSQTSALVPSLQRYPKRSSTTYSTDESNKRRRIISSAKSSSTSKLPKWAQRYEPNETMIRNHINQVSTERSEELLRLECIRYWYEQIQWAEEQAWKRSCLEPTIQVLCKGRKKQQQQEQEQQREKAPSTVPSSSSSASSLTPTMTMMEEKESHDDDMNIERVSVQVNETKLSAYKVTEDDDGTNENKNKVTTNPIHVQPKPDTFHEADDDWWNNLSDCLTSTMSNPTTTATTTTTNVTNANTNDTTYDDPNFPEQVLPVWLLPSPTCCHLDCRKLSIMLQQQLCQPEQPKQQQCQESNVHKIGTAIIPSLRLLNISSNNNGNITSSLSSSSGAVAVMWIMNAIIEQIILKYETNDILLHEIRRIWKRKRHGVSSSPSSLSSSNRKKSTSLIESIILPWARQTTAIQEIILLVEHPGGFEHRFIRQDILQRLQEWRSLYGLPISIVWLVSGRNNATTTTTSTTDSSSGSSGNGGRRNSSSSSSHLELIQEFAMYSTGRYGLQIQLCPMGTSQDWIDTFFYYLGKKQQQSQQEPCVDKDKNSKLSPSTRTNNHHHHLLVQLPLSRTEDIKQSILQYMHCHSSLTHFTNTLNRSVEDFFSSHNKGSMVWNATIHHSNFLTWFATYSTAQELLFFSKEQINNKHDGKNKNNHKHNNKNTVSIPSRSERYYALQKCLEIQQMTYKKWWTILSYHVIPLLINTKPSSSSSSSSLTPSFISTRMTSTMVDKRKKNDSYSSYCSILLPKLAKVHELLLSETTMTSSTQLMTHGETNNVCQLPQVFERYLLRPSLQEKKNDLSSSSSSITTTSTSAWQHNTASILGASVPTAPATGAPAPAPASTPSIVDDTDEGQHPLAFPSEEKEQKLSSSFSSTSLPPSLKKQRQLNNKKILALVHELVILIDRYDKQVTQGTSKHGHHNEQNHQKVKKQFLEEEEKHDNTTDITHADETKNKTTSTDTASTSGTRISTTTNDTIHLDSFLEGIHEMVWELFDLVSKELDFCMEEWKQVNPMYNNNTTKRYKKHTFASIHDDGNEYETKGFKYMSENDVELLSSSSSLLSSSSTTSSPSCIRRNIIRHLPQPARTMYAILKDRWSISRDEWFHEAFPYIVRLNSNNSHSNNNTNSNNKNHTDEQKSAMRFSLGVYTLVQCGLIRTRVLSGKQRGKREVKYEKVCTTSS